MRGPAPASRDAPRRAASTSGPGHACPIRVRRRHESRRRHPVLPTRRLGDGVPEAAPRRSARCRAASTSARDGVCRESVRDGASAAVVRRHCQRRCHVRASRRPLQGVRERQGANCSRAAPTARGSRRVATPPPPSPGRSIGDEVGFDLDGAPDDVAAGATAISERVPAGDSPASRGGDRDHSGRGRRRQATVTCETR